MTTSEQTMASGTALSLNQLTQIARLHLSSPTEWGDPSYDNDELRGLMASGWHRRLESDGNEAGLLLLAVLDEQASEGDDVAAFIWAELSKNPAPHAHIRSLWVRPSHRRKGIAIRLKAELETWAVAQGAKWIQTDVHINNNAMRNLNAKLGYKDTTIQQKKTFTPD